MWGGGVAVKGSRCAQTAAGCSHRTSTTEEVNASGPLYHVHGGAWLQPLTPTPPPPCADDRIPDTDQAIRGGRHGQKLHSGFHPPPPRQGDARGSADSGLSWHKVQGREANRRRHGLTEPTTKALCQTPRPPPPLRMAKMLRRSGPHLVPIWR